jgi:tetratricopeptide (TPR) repeat protein
MKVTQHFSVLAVILLFASLSVALPDLRQGLFSGRILRGFQGGNAMSETQASHEDAYRANNLGVALLEQFKYQEAADTFRRALRIDPKLAIARINLSIALYNVPDLEGSQRESKIAIDLAPTAPQPRYISGLVARAQNRMDDAVAAFQRVLQMDPKDVGANVNLGQLYMQQRKFAEAVTALRVALESEPYNTTALYNLATALLRAGQRDEGQRMMQRFQELRQRGAGTTIGQNYLEQGRYADATASTGAEPELVDSNVPAVSYTDGTANVFDKPTVPKSEESASAANPDAQPIKSRAEASVGEGGGLTLLDFDGDGDLDLLRITPNAPRLYRNDGGKFSDVTGPSGLLAANQKGTAGGAIAGDYDNDGRTDLLLLRGAGGSALYHNDGGKFSDATKTAGIPVYPFLSKSAAFVDTDHDGDLDIFIAGYADPSRESKGGANAQGSSPDNLVGAPNMLLRNNGNGRFTDITGEAKVAGPVAHAVAVVPTDYDNRRDVDLLVVNYGEAPKLFKNMRDGSFLNVATEVGLDIKGRFSCAAAGDVNKDTYTDFFFGEAGGPGLFVVSDSRGRFASAPASAGAENADAAQFLDYDNDGLLDLVTLSDKGARVLRNLGGKWVDVSEQAISPGLRVKSEVRAMAGQRVLVAGDIDSDGDTDLMTSESPEEIRFARNEGGNRNRSVRVRINGRVSNRNGVGAKIEMRAGSLMQKLEVYAAAPAPAPADLVFGLGKRTAADAVRVLWPAGIIQAETEITQAVAGGDAGKGQPVHALIINELDRKPSSCPYLYAWNGERFEFITDFMGGGEMGYWQAPGGHFNTPDPDEYVRIRGDQLKPRQGRYELRVTNELEEALFVDRLRLIAVAHPAGVEVYPNEGMVNPPLPPFKLYATRDARPPVSVTDEHGHNVLSRVAKLDRQYPDDFRLDRIRGYSEEHTLTLKLDDDARGAQRILLLLKGWTDYAFSSDNVASSHAGKRMMPPALQVKDANGRWRTVIDNIGIPVGRPQTVPVDLTGKFLTRSREVRIVTNMRIYWDQILVDTSSGDFPTELTELEPATANLRWRGYSAEVSPDGREPFGYDYERVSFNSPWKVIPGRYTREGDVSELLRLTDDMFVISRTGDELSLSFDATRLPPLREGWTRTFLLYADGFSKEMDINSATPDQVAPLPFHGMSKYPYPATESYPLTEERRSYLERYTTRVVAAPVPRIESALIRERSSPGDETVNSSMKGR